MHKTLFNQQELKRRGWSGRMISQLLGKPDQVQPNPYRWSGPMKLFRKARVLQIERTKAFKQEHQTATVRRQTAKDVAQRKRHAALETARSVPIIVPKFEPRKLARHARNYLDLLSRTGRGVDLTADAPNFEEHLAVKFLYSSSYPKDVFANRIRGKVGNVEASIELHRRVCEAIAAAYPQLSDECQEMLR